jgi:hypothetical protein
MRPRVVLAACFVPLAVCAAVVAACGGPAFTSASVDGGPPGSGGGGGADASHVDAGGSFCAVEAGTHTFCDDFDGPPLGTKWSSILQTGAGTVAADSTKSYSPPSSLKSVVPGTLAAGGGRVVEAFTQTASKVVVAFEVWIDSAPQTAVNPAGSGDNFVEIELGPSYSIGLSAHDEVDYFENLVGDSGVDQNLSNGHLVATSTLESGWTEIVIEVDIAHATLSISFAGQPQLSGATITPPPGQPVSVSVGTYLHGEATNGSLGAHYDNVTIDLTP